MRTVLFAPGLKLVSSDCAWATAAVPSMNSNEQIQKLVSVVLLWREKIKAAVFIVVIVKGSVGLTPFPVLP